MNSDLMEEVKANVFDPTSKIHQNAWSKLSSRPDSKRKKPATPSNEPVAKRKPSVAKTSARVEKGGVVDLTLVLVENTKEVNRGEYVMPTATKMRSLHQHGYIKYVSFPSTSSPSDISRLISDTFSAIPAIDTGKVDLMLWRLLCVISLGQGMPSLLKPHSAATNIALQDLQMASTTHRQAKDFKKCVYIALPRYAGNLPLETENDTDESGAGESEDLPESPTKSPKSARQKPASSQPASGSARPPSAKPSVSPPSRDLSPPAPQSPSPAPSEQPADFGDGPISDAFRLLSNMRRPSATKSWWPLQTTAPYGGALEVVPMIQRQINRSRGVPGVLSVDAILHLVEHDLFPEIGFVLDFGDAVQHEANFRLGPHGLESIVDVLYRFRRFLLGPDMYIPPAHIKNYVERVDEYSAAIYSGLLNLRNSVDREHYDPPNFATVRKILRTRREIFASADEDERFTVLNLSVPRDSPDEFSIRINNDFAINSNGNIMNDACLLVGAHGIDGFMALVDEVLDVLPFSHESYEALYNLFNATCGALGHRMMNYNKSHGKKKRHEKPAAPSGSEDGRSTSNSKDESKAYGTRSSSRSQYKR
ncbi:hypothetical protein B0H11DRAFT_2062122 [Mycena galericulata]|nr:hypothetical protein B0H11DRAFT_2062122 [Mycena galericulata]